MSKQIICIKARSHSDFELYLIGEKYDIPYDFLLNYKKNKRIYKFWTELGSGILSAVEERPNEKTKNLISYAPMSEREKQNLIDIQPIRAGELINKFKGDINEKEEEFKAMLVAKEKYRSDMLSRKFDPSTIICINLKSNNEQLFSICVNYQIDFLEVMSFKEQYGALNLVRLWIEKDKNTRIAYAYINSPSGSNTSPSETFVEIEGSLIPKKAINEMSHKPVTTPKLKVTDESLIEYRKASARGYLSIFKFENALIPQLLIELNEKIDAKPDLTSKITQLTIDELNNLLKKAVEEEEYEFAAKIRDQIYVKNKKRSI
jgi:hypothetical protein